MSARHLLGPSSGTVPVGPPTGFTTVPTGTKVITTSTLGNAPLFTVAEVGGDASGAWSIAEGEGLWSEPLQVVGTGRTVEVRTDRDMTTLDQGEHAARIRYTPGVSEGGGVGIFFDTNLSIRVDPPSPPSAITADPETVEITVADGEATHLKLADLELVGGAGSGTFSLATGSWSKAEISPTSGDTTPILRTNAALVDADASETPKEALIRYNGDVGQVTELALNLSITVSPTLPPVTGDITWKTGVSVADDTSNFLPRQAVYDQWIGRASRVANLYFGHATSNGWQDSPGTVQSKKNYIVTLVNRGVLPVLSVGITTFKSPLWSQLAAQLANVRTFASTVYAATNHARVVYRIGYEPNLASIGPWDYVQDAGNNYVNYKNGFNAVAEAIISQHPNCSIAWCLQKEWWNNPKPEAYPGNANISHITLDYYDADDRALGEIGSATDNYTAWARKAIPIFDYAATKNKKTGVDEWGLRHHHLRGGGGETTGGCDNQQAISYFKKLFTDVGSDFEWDLYFRIDRNHGANDTSNIHSLYMFPNSTITLANVRERTPFQGKFATTPDTAGKLVGNMSDLATGLATARYRQLWGQSSDITQSPADDIAVENTRTTNFEFATVTLNKGGGGGTWGVTGWAKAGLTATTGRQVKLKLTSNLNSGDNGPHVLTVTYNGEGTELSETVTVVVG